MIIKLSPIRWDIDYAVSAVGESLVVNGVLFDLSSIEEGEIVNINSDWFPEPATRTDGELVVVLMFPIPANYSPEQAFPVPLHVTQDGPLQFPQPLPPADEA